MNWINNDHRELAHRLLTEDEAGNPVVSELDPNIPEDARIIADMETLQDTSHTDRLEQEYDHSIKAVD